MIFALYSLFRASSSSSSSSSSSPTGGLGKFLEMGVGKYVFSFLVGLALSTLFFEICEGTDCVAFRGPTLEQVDGAVYRYDGDGGPRCVRSTLVPVECDVTKRVLPFADKVGDAHQTRNETFPSSIQGPKPATEG